MTPAKFKLNESIDVEVVVTIATAMTLRIRTALVLIKTAVWLLRKYQGGGVNVEMHNG